MTQQKDKNNQKGGQSVSQRTLIPRKQDRVQTKEREFGRKEDGKVVIVMRITSQKKKRMGEGGKRKRGTAKVPSVCCNHITNPKGQPEKWKRRRERGREREREKGASIAQQLNAGKMLALSKQKRVRV